METPDTFPSLFFGYTVIWALLSVYIFSISKRLKNIERKLNDNKN